MMSPISRCIVIKWIQLEPFFKLFIRLTKAAFKGVERKIRNAGCRDVSLCIRKPIFLRLLEVFLCSIVDQSNDIALNVDGDQACTDGTYNFNVGNELPIQLRLSRLDCDRVLELGCREYSLRVDGLRQNLFR